MSNSDELKDWIDFKEASATAASSLGAVVATATSTATALPTVAEAGSKALIVVTRFQLLGDVQQIPVSSLVDLKETVAYLEAELKKFDTLQPEAVECPQAFDNCMDAAKSRTQQAVCWMDLVACLAARLSEQPMADDDLTKQKKLEYFKSRLAHIDEMTRATAGFEHAAVKPPLLLNGGAAIATLTLYGAIGLPSFGWEVILVLLALSFWAFGLVFATLATGHAFKSQLQFYKSTSQEIKAIVEREFNKDDAAGAECESKHSDFADKGNDERDKAIDHWTRSLRFFVGGGVSAAVGLIVRSASS